VFKLPRRFRMLKPRVVRHIRCDSWLLLSRRAVPGPAMPCRFSLRFWLLIGDDL